MTELSHILKYYKHFNEKWKETKTGFLHAWNKWSQWYAKNLYQNGRNIFMMKNYIKFWTVGGARVIKLETPKLLWLM